MKSGFGVRSGIAVSVRDPARDPLQQIKSQIGGGGGGTAGQPIGLLLVLTKAS